MNVTRLRFTGTYLDPVAAGYPLGNGYRWYLPWLMRFSGPDDLSPFDVGGINPYIYCVADPINGTDQTGHMFELEVVDEIEQTGVLNFIPHVTRTDNPNPRQVANTDDAHSELRWNDGSQRSRPQKRAAGPGLHEPGTSRSIAAQQAAQAVSPGPESPTVKRPRVDEPASKKRFGVTGISLFYDFPDELKGAEANPLEFPAAKKSDHALQRLHRFASEVASSKRFIPDEYQPVVARWAGFKHTQDLRVRVNQEIQWSTDSSRTSALRMIKRVIGL